MRRTKQEARARQQAQEHEAERLRIEIVTLREALDEETAARASLEGQLRVQREETGERESASHPHSLPRRPAPMRTPPPQPWALGGVRGCRARRMSLDLPFFPSRTEVLEGEYGREPVPAARLGGEGARVWA